MTTILERKIGFLRRFQRVEKATKIPRLILGGGIALAGIPDLPALNCIGTVLLTSAFVSPITRAFLEETAQRLEIKSRLDRFLT